MTRAMRDQNTCAEVHQRCGYDGTRRVLKLFNGDSSLVCMLLSILEQFRIIRYVVTLYKKTIDLQKTSIYI